MSQNKWYGIHSDNLCPSGNTLSWYELAKLNSAFSRIARSSGLSSTPLASQPISQGTLREWEKTARESSYICNQSAEFNRFLHGVQDSMLAQLKVIQNDQNDQTKGKLSVRSQAKMTKIVQHLSDFVFVNMANTTRGGGGGGGGGGVNQHEDYQSSQCKKGRGKASSYSFQLANAQSSLNDNYCATHVGSVR